MLQAEKRTGRRQGKEESGGREVLVMVAREPSRASTASQKPAFTLL